MPIRRSQRIRRPFAKKDQLCRSNDRSAEIEPKPFHAAKMNSIKGPIAAVLLIEKFKNSRDDEGNSTEEAQPCVEEFSWSW